jgi:hypothetical protein
MASNKRGTYFIFCAQDQRVTEWVHLPDQNQEILFQCKECGRFLKYPSGTSRAKLAKLFIEQEKQNAGAIPVEDKVTAPLLPDQLPPPKIDKWYEKFWDAVTK